MGQVTKFHLRDDGTVIYKMKLYGTPVTACIIITMQFMKNFRPSI